MCTSRDCWEGSRYPSDALGTVPPAENERPNVIVYLNLCVYMGMLCKNIPVSPCLRLCGIIIAALIECFCARHLVRMEMDAYENTYVFRCARACTHFLSEGKINKALRIKYPGRCFLFLLLIPEISILKYYRNH